MSRKRSTHIVTQAHNADEETAFRNRVEELREQGYVPMPIVEALGDAYNPNDPSWTGVINTYFASDCCNPIDAGHDVGRAIMSNGYEREELDANGEPHDYIAWGGDNRTPNYVEQWSKLLPYTATSLKHLSELAMGCCVQPKYRFFVASGSTVKTETVDYDAAGDLLRQRLSDAKATNDIDAIKRQQQELDVWKQTNKEVRQFMSDNNLPLFYLKAMREMVTLGMTVPQLILDKQGDVKANSQWQPRVIGIEHRRVAAFRLKKRDAYGRIRAVELSNYWLSDRLVDDYSRDMATLPALDEQRPSADFAERINDWKIDHRDGLPADRPVRWAVPCIYPTSSNYYPYLAWWSIFEGGLYAYLSTIISDRAIRKKNSNSVGRVIYIHTDYLRSLTKEADASKRQKMADELRDEIFRKTTRFLNDKSKNGSALMSFTFPDSRGNMAKAIEIVDVPYASKQQADADSSELADTAAIVFFAMGVHPELIGAIPGSAASKGGTYLRELLLIDEVTSAAVLQQLVNRMFQTIQTINGWDPEHLVWETPQKTLTTLDRNKSGVVEE